MTLSNIFLKFGVFFEVVIATNDIQQNIKPTEVISLIILSCFGHATGQNYCSKITGDDGDADLELNAVCSWYATAGS